MGRMPPSRMSVACGGVANGLGDVWQVLRREDLRVGFFDRLRSGARRKVRELVERVADLVGQS